MILANLMAVWSSIVAILFFIAQCENIAQAQQQPQKFDVNPQVHITLPPNADKDFQNDTLLSMTNANMWFDLHCDAPYPIQWVAFFEPEDDGNSASEKWAETTRSVGNFSDPRTYEYSAVMELKYSGKLHIYTNFSCQSISNWRQQTNVIMTATNQRNVIHLRTTNQIQILPEAPPSIPNCPIRTVASHLNDAQSCWKCETKEGAELELDFYGCETPIECNTFYQRRNYGAHCLRILAPQVQNPTAPPSEDDCKLSEQDYNPKFVACKQFGVALVQFYYFSIVRQENGNRFVYFTWDQIEPDKMLEIHAIEEEHFTGEELTVICELSRFYFSNGIWFGIETTGQKIDYISAVEPPSREENGESEYSTGGGFLRNITLILSPKIQRIYCLGPVWNSDKWINSSVKISVGEGEAPSIVLPAQENSDVSLTLGVQNQVLRCEVRGKPYPQIEWVGPESSQFTVSENKGEMWSQLEIKEVTRATAGEYFCTATSFKGSARRKFSVTASDSYKTLLITLTGILVPLLLIIFVLIVFGWRKIKEQRKALRLLTDAEVREFVEGNPKLMPKPNEYLNGTFVIEALPYDKSAYEIPLDKLQIDLTKLLGSGAFGEVYKGKVLKSNAKNFNHVKFKDEIGGQDRAVENVYQNQSHAAVQAPPGHLDRDVVVAVKTVKHDVDVDYFKALLSEIKIMAFLGVHKNVVCLVGANTGNIRNRQAYIAVEFCEKGSLDHYLAKNKTAFVNHVRYGVLSRESASGGETGPYQNSFGQSFSTFDLFKWAYDIAQGMNYLRDKKVIHGDLAIRNVLVNADATAKVGDFGLSRQLIHSTNYFKKTLCPLPWKWMAPESLTELRFSVHSDVWAYGVTLWELFSLAEVPYKGYAYTKEFLGEVENGLRLDKPVFATNHIFEFMLKCWNLTPEQRPDYEEIIRLCCDLLKEVVPDGYFEFSAPEVSPPMTTTKPTPTDGNGDASPDQLNQNSQIPNATVPDSDNDGYELPLPGSHAITGLTDE